MTRYNDTVHDFEDDIHSGLKDERVLGYRKGVDRVLEYIESIHAYPKLTDELKWAIEEGII